MRRIDKLCAALTEIDLVDDDTGIWEKYGFVRIYMWPYQDMESILKTELLDELCTPKIYFDYTKNPEMAYEEYREDSNLTQGAQLQIDVQYDHDDFNMDELRDNVQALMRGMVDYMEATGIKQSLPVICYHRLATEDGEPNEWNAMPVFGA